MIVRKGDFYFSLVLDFFCAFVFVVSGSFPPEAATFPRISSAMLFVLSCYLMFTSLKGKTNNPDTPRQDGFRYGSAEEILGNVAASGGKEPDTTNTKAQKKSSTSEK
jgi:hypothetical protein